MAVREVRKLGDPVLRKPAHKVSNFDDKLCATLADMADSMEHYQGIGLAGPQIGVDQALVVIKLGDDFPILELVNPTIVQGSGEEVDVEGCLSVPGTFGEVKRMTDVEIEYQDRRGQKKSLKASGFLARAAQHELDHLEGVLFIDKAIRYVTPGEE